MSNLPELPKQIKKREADFGVQLRDWIMKNPRRISCTIETKHTRGKNYLPFDAVKPDQVDFALRVNNSKTGVLVRVQGNKGEADYNYLYKEPAYIVIKYPRCFVFIDIETFLLEKKRSKTKSLAVARAKDIAQVVHSW